MFGLFVSSAQSDVFSGNECDACCVLGEGGGGEAVKASLFTPHKIPLFGFGLFFSGVKRKCVQGLWSGCVFSERIIYWGALFN